MRLPRARQPRLEELVGARKTFVSLFRGALMLATCTAILAVDFHAFPRRFAKAETYGTGYMDVGVGGVVFAAGLVSSSSAVPHTATSGDGRGGGRWRPGPLGRRLYRGFRGAAACWVLGLTRLFTTRAVDYQAHVGEYGVHWNFFNTVAVVALLSGAVALPGPALLPAALAVTAAHQAALSLGGLGPWVMSSERGTDLLSLNKEGIVSCAGFWALHLWGAALVHVMHTGLVRAARHLVRPRPKRPDATIASGAGGGDDAASAVRAHMAAASTAAAAAPGAAKRGGAKGGVGAGAGARGGGGEGDGGGAAATGAPARREAVWAAAAPLLGWWAQLAALDVALWAAVAVLEARVERISRRSCNAAYVVWIAAQCLAGILPLALGQALATAAAAAAATAAGSAEGVEAAPGPEAAGAATIAGSNGGGGSGGGGELRAGGRALEPGARRAGAAAPAGLRAPAEERAPRSAPGLRVLLAINRNQLAVFLFANVLTGLVNLSIDTLQVPDAYARLLLGVYITCVCGVALLLDARGWRLKL